jgi:gliding motility-associated-like protein
VTIIRDTVPPVVDAGSDLETENMIVNLNAVPDAKYQGSWMVVQGEGRIDDPADPRTLIRDLSPGINLFRWSVNKGSCPAVSDEVMIYLKEFLIPNAISPNEDGFNDVFYVTALENYAQVRLQIFNRWGLKVFEDKDYRNNWRGTNSNNQQLPDDTYYYILEIPDRQNYTGFIMIRKNK